MSNAATSKTTNRPTLALGWTHRSLGEIADITMGNSPPGDSYNDHGLGVPLINGPVEFSEGAFGKTIASKFTTAPTKMCQKGDFLICVRGSTTGRTNIAAFDACIGRGVAAIHSRVEQRYVNHFVRTLEKQIYASGNGSTFPSISQQQLQDLQVPLPHSDDDDRSLEEQKRIADILDKADAIRRKRQATLHFTEEFLQASFMDIFGDPITNPSGWPTHTIAQLCTLVRGSSPRPKADPRYYGGPVPRLMVADITRDGWLVTPQIDSLTEEGAKKSRPVPSGTIVMAVSGNVGLMSELAIDACVHDGFVAFTQLQTGVVAPKYLMLTLHFLKVTHEKRKAGAIFQNLTTHDIKALELPIPPLSRQQAFLRIFERAKQSEAKLGEVGTHTENLFNALVQRAFKGEL
jgi:type I restriction enzyme S subunit